MKFLATDIEGQIGQWFDCVDLDDAIEQAEDWLTEQGLYKDDCDIAYRIEVKADNANDGEESDLIQIHSGTAHYIAKHNEHPPEKDVVCMVTFEEDMDGCFHPDVDVETEYQSMNDDGTTVYSVAVSTDDCEQLAQYMEAAPCVKCYEIQNYDY